MNNKNSIFTAVDNKGNEKQYEKIFEFYSEETKKNYIIYTDNELENGLLKVYANTYDATGKNKNLMPIQTDKEWFTIETFLSKLEDNLNEEKDK